MRSVKKTCAQCKFLLATTLWAVERMRSTGLDGSPSLNSKDQPVLPPEKGQIVASVGLWHGEWPYGEIQKEGTCWKAIGASACC